MPRPKRVVTKKVNYADLIDKDESSPESGSDFDDDEDPDKIEVPGGGKDLATAASINTLKDEPKDEKIKSEETGVSSNAASNLPSKIPGGLVTKGNSTLGYEKVRVGGSGQAPFPFSANMFSGMSGLGGMGGMGGMGFFPGMAGMPQHNATQLFQQTMNPFFMGQNGAILSHLLGQSGGLSGKTVSQLWMNDESKISDFSVSVQEEEEVDDEDMGVAETYADYMPSKLKLGKKHPDPVVETASLSSVAPTDVWYTLSLPDETVNTGALSALQLEAITYASQQHEHFLPDGSRAGFLIGDGAGVGKGRTIAGVIFENYVKGRKRAIWISVSNDLKYDAERDLRDIGANKIEVHALNKFKYAKISSAVNGNVKKGVIFSTYSALIGESTQSGGKYKTRLKQLLQWCGEDFDGPVVFDECHRAKNLCPVGSSKPTKTGLTSGICLCYWCFRTSHMAYMTRLGMWGEGTPFPEFTDFISAVEKRGVGAMEIVAMDMKLRGMYIARQLSFHGVAFKIEEVALSKDFVEIYDKSVHLWVQAMQKFQEAAELVDAENRMKKTMWGQFWSSHQRFFKYLCIAAKGGCKVWEVCGDWSAINWCEARTLEQLERDDGELSDFVSTAKGVLQTLVEKHFPAPDRNRIHRLLGLEPPRNQILNPLTMICPEALGFPDVSPETASGILKPENLLQDHHSNSG
ncbi:hypothetical protein L9F63_019166, partial [Diploptera punctata]